MRYVIGLAFFLASGLMSWVGADEATTYVIHEQELIVRAHGKVYTYSGPWLRATVSSDGESIAGVITPITSPGELPRRLRPLAKAENVLLVHGERVPLTPGKIAQQEITFLTWSPDGQTLATASQHSNQIHFWSRQGQLVETLEGDSLLVQGIGWAPDSQRIAAIYHNPDGGSQVRLLDTGKHANIGCISSQLALSQVAWSPDSHWIAVSSASGVVEVWNAACCEPQPRYITSQHWRRVTTLGWSPDSRTLTSSDTRGDIVVMAIASP